MNGKDLFLGLKYVGEDLIDEAENQPFPSRGIEEKTHRKKPRPLLIAALIALMLLLVGCGVVYVLKMQDLKLGEAQVTQDRWDNQQHTMVSQTVSQQTLTLSGLKGTPNYQAAQEWYEFEQSYDPDHQIYFEAKDNPEEFPEQYTFYSPYSREMVDKIVEISKKYDLQLVGAPVKAQSTKALLEYLDIGSILLPDAPAEAAYDYASYYEGGYFHTDVTFRMTDGTDAWPYKTMLSFLYSPKDCFNNNLFDLTGNDWQERNYTTASGQEVLILRSPSVWSSGVFCDLEDATVALRVETIFQVYTDENGYPEVIETPMTDEQLNQILDTINFDLKPNPGDPAILEGQKPSTDLVQVQNGYTVEVKQVISDGQKTAITLGLTAPESIDLEQYLDGLSIRFNNQRFSPISDIQFTGSSGAFNCRADNDGKANTIEFFGEIDGSCKDGLPFPQGASYSLYLEGLCATAWNEELCQIDTLWSVDGIWNFDITMEDGDWREIEFVSEPITTKVCTGWDANGNDVFEDVTLTSLKLRGFGGSFTSTWEGGGLDLADYRGGKFPTVVLKDGTEIRLDGSLGFYDYEDQGELIPLDEVDHLVLMDGTVLYPVIE